MSSNDAASSSNDSSNVSLSSSPYYPYLGSGAYDNETGAVSSGASQNDLA
jgi:hypothetical protein